MSLFGSLYTGTSGLLAQSTATAIVADNVANANTVGYKHSDTVFHDLVTTQTNNSYTPGAVKATRVQRVDNQGQIQQTATATHVSISGNGMFPVKTTTNASSDLQFLYTRDGTFGEYPVGDETYMRNSAGFFLYGWELDGDGNVVSDELVPMRTDIYDSDFLTTTNVTQNINLNASEEPINTDVLGITLPISGQDDADFARQVQVVDDNGNVQNLLLEYRKIVGPTARFTSETTLLKSTDYVIPLPPESSPIDGINAGDDFTLTVGGVTETYSFVDSNTADDVATNQVSTIGGLINALRDHNGGGQVDAYLDAQGRLIVQAVNTTDSITIDSVTGSPFDGPGTFNLIGYGALPLQYAATDIDTTYPGQANFPPFGNTATPNSRGWWEMRILTQTDGQPDTEISAGLLNFDTLGNLNAVRDGDGNVLDGLVSLSSLDFDLDGTADLAALDLDISDYHQFAGGYNVIRSEQNGIEAGEREGIEISRWGNLSIRFTNGQKRDIYKIPVAMFQNFNGLNDISGKVFAQTHLSGEPSYVESGTEGAGIILGETIEASTVDIADEFAHLIVGQRGFQANSKIISTVDEMTRLLGQLKR